MSLPRSCSTGLDSTIREYLHIGRISFCYGAEATSTQENHALPPSQRRKRSAQGEVLSYSGVASRAAMKVSVAKFI